MLRNKKLAAAAGLALVLCAVIATCFALRNGDYGGMERHRKYTLYIGLNDKDTGMQMMSTASARDILNGIAGKYTDGYTVYEADGYWKEDENIFTEHTLVLVAVDVPEQNVKGIMNETLKALNQSSILLEAEEVRSAYYSGE